MHITSIASLIHLNNYKLNNFITSYQITQQLLHNKRINCVIFISHTSIVLGMSCGDIVYIRTVPETNMLVETIIRNETTLQALWSGISGPRQKPSIIALAGH
jgi:hypothetical protein